MQLKSLLVTLVGLSAFAVAAPAEAAVANAAAPPPGYPYDEFCERYRMHCFLPSMHNADTALGEEDRRRQCYRDRDGGRRGGPDRPGGPPRGPPPRGPGGPGGPGGWRGPPPRNDGRPWEIECERYRGRRGNEWSR